MQPVYTSCLNILSSGFFNFVTEAIIYDVRLILAITFCFFFEVLSIILYVSCMINCQYFSWHSRLLQMYMWNNFLSFIVYGAVGYEVCILHFGKKKEKKKIYFCKMIFFTRFLLHTHGNISRRIFNFFKKRKQFDF